MRGFLEERDAQRILTLETPLDNVTESHTSSPQNVFAKLGTQARSTSIVSAREQYLTLMKGVIGLGAAPVLLPWVAHHPMG